MKLNSLKNINRICALFSATIGTWLISWQYFLYGKLFGDLLDARFTIIINEHWFRFFEGKEGLTNLGFYFPTTNQLGYSDGFLATGMISIPFRLMGFSSVQSWLISNLVLLLVCLYFAYLLFESLFHSRYRSMGVTILVATSYPFLAQLGHLQTLGYLLAFPILFFLRQSLSSSSKQKIYWFIASILVLEILALTSWYGFVFFISLCGLYCLLYIFYGGWSPAEAGVKNFSKELKASFMLLRSSVGVFLAFTVVLFILVWVNIYSLGLHSIGKKTYKEFVFYAPRWGDLFNSSTQAWYFQDKWNHLIRTTASPTFERALGFTPILAGSIFFLLLTLQFKKLKQQTIFGLNEKSLLALIPLCLLTLITDEQGHSFWRFIWVAISPIRSIRVPFRVSIYLTWIILYLLFFALGKLEVKKFIFIVLFFLLFFDAWRPVSASWKQSDYLTPMDLSISHALNVNDCHSFFINPKNDADQPWLTQVDAMVISQSVGISTINGYSGDWPNDWPIKAYWGGASAPKVINWIKKLDKKANQRFCYFDLKNTKMPIQIFKE